jgi:TonB family protein
VNRYLLSVLALFLGVGVLVSGSPATTAKSRDALQSFYIVSHVVSDAAPLWYDYVLDVTPVDRGVLIRDIRLAPLNSYCNRPVTVKAAERVVPNSNVKSLAKIPLCSFNEADVAAAIEAARSKSIESIDDSVRFTIVAKCGTTSRIFDLPFPELMDFALLKRKNPAVASLWNLSLSIRRRVFGKNFSFYGVSRSQDSSFQELGSRLAPALKSGMYDQGFARDAPLSSVMDDYVGPVEDPNSAHVELFGVSSARFRKYMAPRFPPLALQARIQGDVRLRIRVEIQTGDVQVLEVISGHPLLVDAALAAVRQWQFQPDADLQKTYEVGLKFDLGCSSR